jgi:hypothetical protein
MSMISAVQTYIKTYTGLVSGAPVWVNYLNQTPTAYSVDPLPGSRKLEEYLDGGSLREFPFALRIIESITDDAERLDNARFAEAFADWLDSQTKAGTLPTLDSGKTAEKIEAVNWGYIDQQGESGTAIYLVSCRLEYGQDA